MKNLSKYAEELAMEEEYYLLTMEDYNPKPIEIDIEWETLFA